MFQGKQGTANEDEGMAKFRNKIENLKMWLQEDIDELSSEDEQ